MVHPRHVRTGILPPATEDEVDSALRVLRDSDSLAERSRGFQILKTVPRETVKARMDIVRPWQPMADGFQQAKYSSERGEAENCVCYIGSQGYEDLLEASISSALKFGGNNFRVLVLCVGVWFYKWALSKWPVVTHSGKVCIELVQPVGRICTWIKTAQLLAPKILKANNYVLLEGDTLVVDSLSPLFKLMDACSDNTIFGVAPNNPFHTTPMANHIKYMGGNEEDVYFIGGTEKTSAKFLFNGGLYAGKSNAISILNDNLASLWPYSALWAEGGSQVRYGEEAMTNWAISMPNLQAITLDESWNVQFCEEFREFGRIGIEKNNGETILTHNGKRSKILHILGDRNQLEPRPFFWEAKEALAI